MPAPKDIELLAAEMLLAKAFMIEVAAWMATMADDKEAWVGAFISSLHQRLDAHEISIGGTDAETIHELARQRADELGDTLRN